jgi:hypothetical protein
MADANIYSDSYIMTGARVASLVMSGGIGSGARVSSISIGGSTSGSVPPVVSLTTNKNFVEAGYLIILNAVAGGDTNIVDYTWRLISINNSVPAPLIEDGDFQSQKIIMAPPSNNGCIMNFGVKVTNDAAISSTEATVQVTVAPAVEYFRIGGVMVPTCSLINLPG